MWRILDEILRSHPATTCAVLAVGLMFGVSAQETAPVVHTHAPSTEVFHADCASIQKAATTYLKTRGIEVQQYRDSTRHIWCPAGQCFTFHLVVSQLLDDDYAPLTWERVKQLYTWDGSKPIDRDRQRLFSSGSGYWDAASRWKVGGYLELDRESKGCFVRIDYGYLRNIRRFLVIFPFELYDQSLLSNDRLEAESLSGIRKAAGLK